MTYQYFPAFQGIESALPVCSPAMPSDDSAGAWLPAHVKQAGSIPAVASGGHRTLWARWQETFEVV